MTIFQTLKLFVLPMVLGAGLAHADPNVCQNYGPQTPRDISSADGSNSSAFPLAPAANKMNLCNVHFHMHAEHKGPGFSKVAGEGGGFLCNDAPAAAPAATGKGHGEHAADSHAATGGAHAGCEGVKAGDTIEVHWVFSTCNIQPGKGLGACSSAACANPTLRVESQVFLVSDDPKALNFADFDYAGKPVNGIHQPKALPAATGTPVVFRGSTTGPNYDQLKCSPLQATWSVRPRCAKVSLASLNAWCAHNTFEEHHGHGVRPLVTARELLDKIQAGKN